MPVIQQAGDVCDEFDVGFECRIEDDASSLKRRSIVQKWYREIAGKPCYQETAFFMMLRRNGYRYAMSLRGRTESRELDE